MDFLPAGDLSNINQNLLITETIKLAIVLSQTDKPSTEHRDFEEELVAILLMKDGLEVSIIGDIANIREDSTDALCLEGIRGNLFFASWYTDQQAKLLLESAGVVGSYNDRPVVLPIANAGHYDPLQRTIQCLDLSQFNKPIDARRSILKSIQERNKTTAEEAKTHTSPDTDRPAPPPTRPMPKRQVPNETTDALDSLLDTFNDIDL